MAYDVTITMPMRCLLKDERNCKYLNKTLSATNNNSSACGFRNKTFLRQCNQTLLDPTIVVCNHCPDSNVHTRECIVCPTPPRW